MPEARAVKRGGRGRWRRRLAWGAAGVATLLLSTVATVDWWLPPVAEKWSGATFLKRETRFGEAVTWTDAVWSTSGVVFKAASARIDAPSRMLLRGRANAQIDGWTLMVSAPEKTSDERKRFGLPELLETLHKIGPILERRVGEARLSDGRVVVAGEEIELPRFTIAGGAARGLARWRGEEVEFEMPLDGRELALRWARGEVAARLAAEGSAGLKAEITWAGNAARGQAGFVAGEWIPKTLDLKGEDWRIPAERLGLAPEYAELRGGFVVNRAGGGFGVTVDATAEPKRADLPAVKLSLGGEARPDAVRLDRLTIEAPQLHANLSAPLEWRSGAGWNAAGEPEFSWSAELGELTEGRITGRTEGTARWTGSVADWRLAWEARGEAMGWGAVQGVTGTLRGETTATATRLLAAELRDADGSMIEATGRYLHAERKIEDGTIKAAMTGATVAPWAPEGLVFQQLAMDGRIAGKLADLKLDGQVRVAGVEYEGWVADQVEATVSGSRATALRVRGKAERAGANLEADLSITGGSATAAAATIRRSDGRVLKLVGPALARFTEVPRAVTAEWGGEDERLVLSWEEGRAGAVLIQNLNTLWIADWRRDANWPLVAVRRLEVEGRAGAGGWIEGKGSLDAVWTRFGEPAGWARLEGTLGEQGLSLGRLEIGRAEEVLASGAGEAPWRVRAGAKRELSPVEGGQWSLHLESRPEATLWDALAKLAGVELEKLAVSAALSGSAAEPSGRLELSATRIGLVGEGLPDGGLELRELQLTATVSRGDLTVERLTAEADGQRIEADGRLAMEDGDWEKLRARPFVWLGDHAEARLRLPEARVAALARYLPTVLAPTGTVAGELKLTPGANLSGSLRLSEGATRPLGGFGVLQGIDVELALSGRDVRIERMRATAGGQAVVITGGARRIPGRIPALDLKVNAERFPLVRRTGLLLRGDLDLAVKTDLAADGTAGRTRVSGEVRLRDSLFLADIRPLITSSGGGGAAAVGARPPYFSVETPPLADWELGLRVSGERFLRMRTPVFEGTGSARFDLTGTLRDPRAVGEFWVAQGSILFPFATFAVQEGAVRLRASDPYTPLLDFRATGRRLGYDLRLELGGTAEAPQLQLFSSPPLEAENLLLMVTAGAAPAHGQDAASTSQRLAAVGAYVGRDLLRTLGVGGADEERLTLSSGEKISRQGRETYGFEFRLDDAWSLAGEYDEFDAYNVGVKRRIRSRMDKEAEDKKRAETAGPEGDDNHAR